MSVKKEMGRLSKEIMFAPCRISNMRKSLTIASLFVGCLLLFVMLSLMLEVYVFAGFI
jgi:hypothetical protein